MLLRKSSPLTIKQTWDVDSDIYMAACPAELPAPTTATFESLHKIRSTLVHA